MDAAVTGPSDPVNPMAAQAITWHQLMTEYEAAGFTRAEAFELVSVQVNAYWSAMYDDLAAKGSP